MLRDIEVGGYVSIPKDYLDRTGVIRQSSILTSLSKELLNIKSTEKHGYYIAITKLNNMGNGELEEETQDVKFPISFSCRTFLPIKGEIMFGVVYKVHNLGVFLRRGPLKLIYLSSQKMPNFYYSSLENHEGFVCDDLSRIEKDVVVCFVVFAVRWGEREFTLLASLEGEGLGPVSLSGNDELDL